MTIRTISQLLSDITAQFTDERITMSQLLEAFHERGFGFLIVLFSIPMGVPIPVPPGANLILGAPLILLTAQQAIGRETIWIPKFLHKKTLKRSSLVSIINHALPWLERLEVLLRPRLGFITDGIFSHIIGVLGFFMALAVCIPIPLTNTVPSFGISLMALGVMTRDGLAVIIGATIGTLWMLMLCYITITLGTEGIDLFKDTIKSFL